MKRIVCILLAGLWLISVLPASVAAADAAPGNYPITVTYNPNDVYNIAEENLDFAIVDGGVTVEATPNQPAALRGDVNGDGNVTVADYGLALSHVRGTKLLTGDKLAAADVNGDGQVSVADYGLILAHVRGTKMLG